MWEMLVCVRSMGAAWLSETCAMPVCLWAGSLALQSLIIGKGFLFLARILCVDAYVSFYSVKLKVA